MQQLPLLMALEPSAGDCQGWWLHAKPWCGSDPGRLSCKSGDRGHGSNVMGWRALRKINESGHKLIVFLPGNQQIMLTLTFSVIKEEYGLGSLVVSCKETECFIITQIQRNISFVWYKILAGYSGMVKAVFPSTTLTTLQVSRFPMVSGRKPGQSRNKPKIVGSNSNLTKMRQHKGSGGVQKILPRK